jgi:sugar lactone lactonase YvrE
LRNRRSDRDAADRAIDVINDGGDLCGEGPIWDDQGKRLIWDDLGSSLMFEYSGASTRVISRGLMIASIALGVDRRLVVAGEAGLHAWRGQGDYVTLRTKDAGESLSFNDMVVDTQGRIYAATLYWDATGMVHHGKLYLVNHDASLQIVDEGIRHANGLGLSPDGRTLYFADTAARSINAYEVEPATGSLTRRRILVKVADDEGLPDGLTVDEDGFIWSAQWFGGCVVRYDPEGVVERRIALPVTQTSSLAFGGPDLTDLYVTSAAERWRSDLAPPGYNHDMASPGGSLFRVHLDIRGRAENRTLVGV